MIKGKTVAIIALSLIVGIAIGAYFASRYWLNYNSQFILSGEITRVEADIMTNIAVLARIRAGKDKEAIKIQEMLLDSDIITAGALVKKGHKLSPNVLSSVVSEIKARKLSNYEIADPSTRVFVQEMLNILVKSAAQNGAQQGAPAGAQNAARP